MRPLRRLLRFRCLSCSEFLEIITALIARLHVNADGVVGCSFDAEIAQCQAGDAHFWGGDFGLDGRHSIVSLEQGAAANR